MEVINYWPLLLVFIIAWIVPLLLSWLEFSKMPAVIVEIIMGVIIGPFVLDLMEETPYMDFLAKTGFLFLIFLAGLEIDVDKIIASLPRSRVKVIDLISNSLILAIFIYFGSLALSLPFALLVNQFIEVDVYFMALLLPTVALSITVPILKADGELTRKFGQILLMEGAIATVMSIILISVYAGILKNGFQVELLLFTVIFGAFFVTYYIAGHVSKIPSFQKLLYRLEHAASQIRVRGTVALLLIFVIIAALIDTELIMGAFFAGAVLSFFVSKERSSLLFKLDGMSYGFFIPIFFIMVGVNLDLGALSNFKESIPFIVTLTIGFFLTQIIPALVMTKVFGLKKALAGGVLLTARLGLTIATAQIGLSLGLISTAENAGIVASSILVSLVSPLAYKFFHNGEEVEHHNVYILGGAKASLYLAERLSMHNISCLTIFQNFEIIPDFEGKNLNFKYIEPLDKTYIDSLKLRTSEMVVVLTESEELNEELTRHIKKTLNHNKIITSQQVAFHDLKDPNSEVKFIDKDEILADHIEQIIARPDSVSSLSKSFDEYRVEEILMTNTHVHRKLVKKQVWPKTGSLVILRRGNEIFIPHGDTHLLLGDIITVIGNGAALADFRNTLE